jgi:hypothetical protein
MESVVGRYFVSCEEEDFLKRQFRASFSSEQHSRCVSFFL